MQTKRNLTSTIVLIALIMQSCIYEYLPKAVKYENFLVVYGMITNENGPHILSISKTFSLDNHGASLVLGAKATLSDDKGNTIPLTEDSTGYLTPGTFAGQIGTKYKLNFVLPDGKQYESDYVELLDVPGISDIKAEEITKPGTSTTAESEGYQFYISTEPGSSEQKYFKWEIDEDWEFDMPYIYDFYWDGKDLTGIRIPYQCYSQRHLSDFFISTTNNSQINYISNYPLHFVSKYDKLKYGYGIRVRQYALSEFSYNFWENVIENDNPNAINSKQQYPLVGNIKCISNPDEPVYGIFEASAVKIKNLQAKILYVAPQTADCGKTKMVQSLDPQTLILEPPAMITAHPPLQWGTGFLLVRDPKCIYCEATDGTTIRPDYWGKNK